MIKRLLSDKRKRIGLLAIVMLVGGVSLAKFIENNTTKRVYHHTEYENKYDNNIKPTEFSMEEDYSINKSFTSHLPLVVIDVNGKEVKSGVKWDDEKGYYAPTGEDPYIKGYISVIDNDSGINSIEDKSSIESDILIKLRGNTSTTFPKKQYKIKTINEDNTKNKQDILGMGYDSEWVLNISYIDTTFLRNYMALNIAGEIMPYTPDVRYCEVVMKDGDKYSYEGLYLMMESVDQGDERVAISDYDDKFTSSSYLLRRDRYEEDAVLLDNYSTKNKLPVGYLEVKYPSKKDITNRTIQYITEDINEFEEAIYSDDVDEFYKYEEYIDVDSFIDYFIINEFFANYDSGYHSTYIYKENGSKISMGPVWDFDMSLNNELNQDIMFRYDSTAMHDSPWFRQLLKDSNFTNKLINRYYELRKGVLSEENLHEFIDSTIDFLGSSVDRDRQRWTYDKDFSLEVNRMKEVIIDHGSWLDENIDSLYQFSEFKESDKSKDTVQQIKDFILGENQQARTKTILGGLFIFVFIISIILVQRED